MALSTRSSSQPAVGATRARQGRLGRPVLWVLLFSLLLVVIGFFAAWTWKAGDLSSVDHAAQAGAAARSFNAPQPAGASRQNYQTGGVFTPDNHGNPGQPNRSSSTEP